MRIQPRMRVFIMFALVAAAAVFAMTAHGEDTENAYNLSEGRLVSHALMAVERDYLEPDRVDPKAMLKGALEQMERLVPEILVTYHDDEAATITVGIAAKKFHIGALSKLADLQRTLIDMLRYIDMHYDGDVEKDTIEYAAVEGMLSELDPHSSFLPPKVFEEFRVGTRGTFGGLGIVIGIRDGNLTVIAPLEGTPAWRAGVRAGDQIAQIGDESTINMSLTDAVNKLRGKVGTKVKLVISRTGQSKPLYVTLTRAIINIDSVQPLMLVEADKRVGYIKIKSFQANTDADFTAALENFHKGGSLDGLIIDLRNNPGGLLNQAVDIADHFLSGGAIVKTVASRGQLMDMERATSLNVEPDYPIILLINEGSASASEIVAGALMANDRALSMGHRSFGKGSVQTIFEIGDGSAVKLTIAQYLPAGTMSIQSVGVTPDIELVPKTVAREHMNLVDDVVTSELDLEKHLEKTGEMPDEPFYRAPYFQPYEKEDEDSPKRLKEYEMKPRVDNDFAVQLAKKLLAGVSSSSRKEMLKQIKVPLDASDVEQEAIIIGKLRELGIDWSTTPRKEQSLLQIAYNIRHNDAVMTNARAGSDVELELIATNIGTGIYARLLAVGQSDSSLLKNQEFVFGKLAPAQRRSWRVPVTIPESMPTQDLTMDLTFNEEHDNTPEPLTVIIPVQGVEPPVFAFNYRLEETGSNIAGRGTLNLAVSALNVGKGTSSADTVMTLANKGNKDVFIKRGRAAVGAIRPGGSSPAVFQFSVAKGYAEPTIDLELSIVDLKALSILTKTFTVAVKDGVLSPPAGVQHQPPAIVLEPFTTSTDAATVDIEGRITDNDPIRDFFIFVGDKKAIYTPNASGSDEMKLRATLPLTEGNNTVSIAARDTIDLTGRKVIVIRRVSAAKKSDNIVAR